MSADSLVRLRSQCRFDFNSFCNLPSDDEDVLAQDGARRVLVDLPRVQYIGSAALGILPLLRDKAAPQGIKVELANLQGTLKDVLEIANVHKIFTIR